MTYAPGVAGRRRIVVAITGASGAAYGVRAVEMLRSLPEVETHLIITSGARKTLAYETATDAAAITKLADVVYHEDDLAAPISSGSYRTDGIIVPPVPTFYHRPRTVDDIVNQTVGRILDLFDLDVDAVQRWEGSQQAARRARANRRTGDHSDHLSRKEET